jgi:hypothetical protein
MYTTPLTLLLLFLYTYLPRKFLLNAPTLALEHLSKHHAFVLRTKHFYKRLSAALADMIFAKSVRVQAPMQFESDYEEDGDGEDVDI